MALLPPLFKWVLMVLLYNAVTTVYSFDNNEITEQVIAQTGDAEVGDLTQDIQSITYEGLGSSSVNNSLAYLLSLGNETDYLSNLVQTYNRTGRSDYGSGWGGNRGFDPALLLLLKDRNRDWGWGWGWPQQQQQQATTSSSGLSSGLTSLLALALIANLPTQ